MKRLWLVLILLFAVVFPAQLQAMQIGDNYCVCEASDNLQKTYNKFKRHYLGTYKSPPTANSRWKFLIAPGVRTDSLVCDTDYIDVMEQYPRTVKWSSLELVSVSSGVDSVVEVGGLKAKQLEIRANNNGSIIDWDSFDEVITYCIANDIDTLYMSAGIYNLSVDDNLRLPDNFIVYGEGENTILIPQAGFGASATTYKGAAIQNANISEGNSNIEIKNISIDYTDITVDTADIGAIHFENVSTGLIENCYILNSGRVGIQCIDSDHVVVRYNTVPTPEKDCISIDGNSSYCQVYGNTVSCIGDYSAGIEVQGGVNNIDVFENFVTSTKYGIAMQQGSGASAYAVTIRDNNIKNTSGTLDCIRIVGDNVGAGTVKGLKITGNTVEHLGTADSAHAIYLQYIDDAVVALNNCKSAYRTVRLRDCNNTSVDSNRIETTNNRCLWFYGDMTGNHITNNKFIGASESAIYIWSAVTPVRTLISGNKIETAIPYGIYFGMTAAVGSNNRCYGNDWSNAQTGSYYNGADSGSDTLPTNWTNSPSDI